MNIEAIGWIIAAGSLAFTVFTYFDKKKSQRVKLHVKFKNGLLTYHDGGLSKPMLFINAANVGNKSVMISSVQINIKHGNGGSLFTQFGHYQQLPYLLEPGDSFASWHEIKPIAVSLKRHGLSGKIKLEGYVTSKIGSEYKSKPYELDVDDWSQ